MKKFQLLIFEHIINKYTNLSYIIIKSILNIFMKQLVTYKQKLEKNKIKQNNQIY